LKLVRDKGRDGNDVNWLVWQSNVVRVDGRDGNDINWLAPQFNVVRVKGRGGNEGNWLITQFNVVRVEGRGGNDVNWLLLHDKVFKFIKYSTPVKFAIFLPSTYNPVAFLHSRTSRGPSIQSPDQSK